MFIIIIIINLRLAWAAYIPRDSKLYAGNASSHCIVVVVVVVILIIIIIIIIIMKFETLARHLSGYWLDNLYSTPDRSGLEFFCFSPKNYFTACNQPNI